MVALMFWLSAADQIVVTSSPIAVADNRIGTAAAATLMIPVLMKPSPVAPAMMRGSAIRPGVALRLCRWRIGECPRWRVDGAFGDIGHVSPRAIRWRALVRARW